MQDTTGYVPEFSGTFEAYAINTIHRNMWRLPKWMDFEDMQQEAALVFVELKNRYKERVDNPRWLMGLFKVALANKITDLSNLATRHRKEVSNFASTDDGEAVDLYEISAGELDCDGLPCHKLANLSGVARDALEMLLSLPPETRITLEKSWQMAGHKNAFGDAHLQQLMGIDSSTMQGIGGSITGQWRSALFD